MTRFRSRLSSYVLVCLGLAGATTAAAAPARGKPAAAAKSDKVDAKSIVCSGDAQVRVLQRDVKLICKDGYRDCETDLPLVAKNCTKGYLEFVKLEVFESGRRSLVLEFSPPSIVGPNGLWQEKIPWTTPGDLEAAVYFRPSGGSNSDSVRGEVKVRNAGLDGAHTACEHCNGTWGRWGVNQKEGCNCKTKDAGKECRDGDQCQGQCMFVTYDGKGGEVGQCSDKERVLGCVNIVAKGQSKVPPKNPPPRKLPTCLD